ncbi:MAG: DUF4124 domain-containing protein [Gammaproteobacteria bacterium]|nr:MAG: DUF4124 domain-containing protein [Gammaproteobacteria bacterium]
MKLFAKFLIAALFIAMLLPFTIIKGPEGRPLMSFSNFSLSDFSMPDLPDVPSGGKMQSAIRGNGGEDIFYQWYDSDGNVQFTSEPPPKGVEYTTKGFDPDTNLIQALELPQEESEPAQTEPASRAHNPEDIGNPYSAESIQKLLEEAKNVEKLFKQRIKDQESALNQ